MASETVNYLSKHKITQVAGNFNFHKEKSALATFLSDHLQEVT